MHNPALAWPQKAAPSLHVGDVLVLAILARLLAPGRGVPGPPALTIGTGPARVRRPFGLLRLYSSFRPRTAADLGWVLFYAACRRAAQA